MIDLNPGDKVRLKNGPHLGRYAAKAGATGIVGPLGAHNSPNIAVPVVDIIWNRNDLWNKQCDGGYETSCFEVVSEEAAPTKIDYMQITRDMCRRR